MVLKADSMIKATLKERVLRVLEYKKLNVNSASRLLGIPQRTLNRQINENGSVGMDLVYSLLATFADIAPAWLVLGEGEMLTNSSSCCNHSSPFYSDIPVTAGNRDAVDPTTEAPSGYISMPQWHAQFYFPVLGTSMEPEIYSGDIIGVNRVDSLRDMDPEKIYMIVTNETRMIKRCYTDKDNSELLWCVSPNYPSFTINKRDIRAIFHVVNRIERL